jgi:hypothetical protein
MSNINRNTIGECQLVSKPQWGEGALSESEFETNLGAKIQQQQKKKKKKKKKKKSGTIPAPLRLPAAEHGAHFLAPQGRSVLMTRAHVRSMGTWKARTGPKKTR